MRDRQLEVCVELLSYPARLGTTDHFRCPQCVQTRGLSTRVGDKQHGHELSFFNQEFRFIIIHNRKRTFRWFFFAGKWFCCVIIFSSSFFQHHCSFMVRVRFSYSKWKINKMFKKNVFFWKPSNEIWIYLVKNLFISINKI